METDKTRESDECRPDVTLDLRGATGPLLYAETYLQLMQMRPGQILEVLYTGWSLGRMPIALQDDGHRVLRIEPWGREMSIRLWVRKQRAASVQTGQGS